MSSSACRYTAESFLSQESQLFADESVASVFSMMLSISAEPTPVTPPPIAGANGRTAIVGFSGSLRGSCDLRLSTAAACAITSAMLGGASIDEDDDSIDDAVGELCNMIAGGWKNRVDSLAATCALSPPTVISGCNYKIHVNASSARLQRTYTFRGHHLQLTLHYLEPRTFTYR